MGKRQSQLEIIRDWRGEPIPLSEYTRLTLTLEDDVLEVGVEAPFHADPPPPHERGRVDELWQYEVVELFLLGADEHYLEVELGPHGHHLVLALEGRRNVTQRHSPIDFEPTVSGGSWTGRARFDARLIPDPIGLGNAYAMHGHGSGRSFKALHPVPGPRPDFHRLEHFGPIGL